MDTEFDDSQPIYQQIIQRICAMILRGDLQPGGKLPSVIDAAIHYKVNHNTIQRVYMELLRRNITTTKRGEGTFVTTDRAILRALHEDMRASLLNNFLEQMRGLGYSPAEIINALAAHLQASEQPSEGAFRL